MQLIAKQEENDNKLPNLGSNFRAQKTLNDSFSDESEYDPN